MFCSVIVFACLFVPIKKLIKNPEERIRKKNFLIILSVITIFLFVSFLSTEPEKKVPSNDPSNKPVNKPIHQPEKKTVTVIDFSNMTKEEINTWCDSNQITCRIVSDYSDSIPKDGFINQSVSNNEIIEEGDKITITFSLGRKPTLE